jgi:hypothetical protein
MSLRHATAVADPSPTHCSRLELVLRAGSRALDSRSVVLKPSFSTPISHQATPRFTESPGSVVLSLLGPKPNPIATAASIEGLTDGFSYLGMEDDIDATRKRKVDGSLAATRLGQTTTQRWANERFRQTMLLVLEFRMEWPTQSLLTSDDVEGIHTAIDNALVFATNSSHVGDIYDTNPTCWAIWLVQRAHTLKAGGWTAETTEAQQRLSFKHLYEWLQAQHSKHERHDLRDHVTKKVVHRYKLPFKRFAVPPPSNLLFKYRKSAQRLSDWIVQGSNGQAAGLRAGIIAQAPAALVAPPPGQAAREARASAAWGRARGAAQRRSRLPLRSVQGDSVDAQETRVVVRAVMRAAAGAGSSSDDSDDEMAAQLEREMEEDEGGDGAGPSRDGSGVLEDIRRSLLEDSDDGEADGQAEPHQGGENGSGSGGGGASSGGEEQAEPHQGGENGSGSGGGGGASSGGEELSAYELERGENIRRNQARLKELGLDDPIVPPRPRPASRQPRPPRPPEGPRRESSRLKKLSNASSSSSAQ